jgi:hypothetical protein
MQIVHRLLEIVGGLTVVLGAIAAFFRSMFLDYLKQHWKTQADIKTDEEKGLNAIKRIQPENYMLHQFQVSVELWQALATLRSAVDALWESVTEDNLVALNKQLREIDTKTYAWSLFFEERHVAQLRQAIRTLGEFRAGKEALLYEANSREKFQEEGYRFSFGIMQDQINKNQQYKEQFELLIKEMQDSLRKKLSGRSEEKELVDSK